MTLREARVDLDAIRHNVRTLLDAVGVPGMVVVKADGYGHGAVRVARAALEGGASGLGVADVTEALQLRAAGIEAPVLAWIHGAEADFDAAVAHNVELGVSSLEQLCRAADAGATVQLKTDTGLSRNGVAEDQLQAVFAEAARLERSTGLRVRGIWSHLANASLEDDLAQVAAFEAHVAAARAAGLHPEVLHLAATEGALRRPSARFDQVRFGIGVYGLSPLDGVRSADLGLRPAMELSAEIVAVRRVRAGRGVSYGYTYRTAGDTTLALVGIGYADGVPRQASNSGPVVVNGERFTVSGRIAMDQFIVDVGDAQVQAGDRAVLFGDPATGAPSADEWARAASTINYEIVTRIGPRVPRRYVP
ncbi:alanine racemase [Lysobacter korlensis]|uniref:Alanine racemase n=1 Tax=Lysobacter korlensis TaxID=553636 RepID=A0ABV6RUX5_9GAMM